MSLSDTACRAFKPGPKPIRKSDGGGLYLQIQPNGSKLWQMAYRFPAGGKQKTLSFGPYPTVTLAAARARRDDAKRVLAERCDPGAKGAVAPVDRARLFRTVAEDWFATRIVPERKPANAKALWSYMERDVLPALGDRPIDRIEPADVMAVLRAMEARKVGVSVRKVLGYINGVFRFAKPIFGLRHNPASDLSGQLVAPPPVKHLTSLPPAELPGFFAVFREPGVLRPLPLLGVEIAMHVVLRPGELGLGRWDEIRGDEWHVPAERMKLKRLHVVLLSPQALALLERLRKMTGNGPFMFPNRREDQPVDPQTFVRCLHAMGLGGDTCAHGFRSTFSTWAHDSGRWPSEWIEGCLAHVVGNKVHRAYNRSSYLLQRREIMCAWSDFLAEQEAAGAEIAIQRDLADLLG